MCTHITLNIYLAAPYIHNKHVVYTIGIVSARDRSRQVQTQKWHMVLMRAVAHMCCYHVKYVYATVFSYNWAQHQNIAVDKRINRGKFSKTLSADGADQVCCCQQCPYKPLLLLLLLSRIAIDCFKCVVGLLIGRERNIRVMRGGGSWCQARQRWRWQRRRSITR